MKIAITGHKKGIGRAFEEQLTARGHHIVGISRSDGGLFEVGAFFFPSKGERLLPCAV